MARPKTSVDRLGNLRKTFQSNKGKVLTAKQVSEAVGAAYWRACVRDLKSEGMSIESVREGRNVVGYKYVDIKDPAGSTKRTVSTKEVAAVAASKPKTVAKKPVAKKAAAKKGKTPKKMTAAEQKAVAKKNSAAIQATDLSPVTKKVKGTKKVAEVIEETPAGEEDPDVLAILQQSGLA